MFFMDTTSSLFASVKIDHYCSQGKRNLEPANPAGKPQRGSTYQPGVATLRRFASLPWVKVPFIFTNPESGCLNFICSMRVLALCGIPVYSAFCHKCPVQTRLRNFLLSLPERGVRSATALAGGLLREVGDVAIPKTVRRSRLYRNLVEVTLRFLIQQVGQVKDVYPGEENLSEGFLVRR